MTTLIGTMHIGICRKCGEKKAVDCCGYCTPCYPWDEATDMHKRAVETRTRQVRGGNRRRRKQPIRW